MLRFGAGAAAAAGLAAILLAVEAVSTARLSPDSETLPVRIYARPPALHLGQRLDAAGLHEHFRRIGFTRLPTGVPGPGQYVAGRREWRVRGREIGRLGPFGDGGLVRARLDSWGRITSLEDGEGLRYRAVPLEPELLAVTAGPGARDQVPVRLADLPAHLVDAVLAAEDRRFHEHFGLDFRRIAGAALANLRNGRVVQGGSTITQQLAKNRFLDSRRTLVRKAREAAMALVLEARHTKAEILAAYLDEVYLGHEDGRAIHGVGRAAEVYFGKDAARLSLAEAALLAGLIRGPNLYSPARDTAAALARRDVVLQLMVRDGRVSESAALEAAAAPLPQRTADVAPPPARYFTDFVAGRIRTSRGASGSPAGGSVVTSLDADLQRAAVKALRAGIAELEGEHEGLKGRGQAAGSLVQAALVALDPRTGDVLAMVGGREYGRSQFNRAVQARRQPGSSFKPIVALAALSGSGSREAGPFSLATVLLDAPLEVETPAGPWQPVNYDGRFSGTVTLREALERSLNVPFARLGLEVGADRIVRTARVLGIESRLRAYPSIALGAFEVTPLEMARAYGTLAAGGLRAETRPILGWIRPDGQIAYVREPAVERAVTAAEAYLVTSALRGAVERGTGRGLRARGFAGDVAAKSGTTNGFRDGWFIGYTPTLVVAVWVGFDDGRSLGLPGARVALPIFARFMEAATGRHGDRGAWGSQGFRAPPGLEVAYVDPETGLREGPGCPGRPELFLKGTAPLRSCSPFAYGSRRWSIGGTVPGELPRPRQPRGLRNR